MRFWVQVGTRTLHTQILLTFLILVISDRVAQMCSEEAKEIVGRAQDLWLNEDREDGSCRVCS
jgi:hypothetical protein